MHNPVIDFFVLAILSSLCFAFVVAFSIVYSFYLKFDKKSRSQNCEINSLEEKIKELEEEIKGLEEEIDSLEERIKEQKISAVQIEPFYYDD